MKEITVKVSDKDVDAIIRIGRKPWIKCTDEEQHEFDRLISYHGTAVLQKVDRGEWIET